MRLWKIIMNLKPRTMKDKEIEQLAFELYPKTGGLVNEVARGAFQRGAKKVRDYYERKIALIQLTQMGEAWKACIEKLNEIVNEKG